MKRLVLTLLCATAIDSLVAQTTLDEYRSAVSQYSWQLKIAASNSEAAAQNKEKAHTGYLPRLSADGSFSANIYHYDGVRHWDFAVQPQIIQTIYGGGAVRAAYRQAQLGYDIALCDEEFSLLDVRYAADYAYWSLSSAAAFHAAMLEYVNIIRSLKEVVDRRFAEGYIAKGDVLMIQTRLNEAEYQMLNAEQGHIVALHNFNILRGTNVYEDVTLEQNIRDSLATPQRISLDQTLIQRPDFTAATLRTFQAEEGVKAVRAPYNPQVSLGVMGLWAPFSPNRTGDTYVDGSAFVKVSVPIFHWGERRRAVGAARAQQTQSEWRRAMLQDDILREEINGWTSVVEGQAQVSVTENSLRIAGENLDISTYSYGEGLATILDVLQAQLSWIQLYSNTIQAHYNYAVAISAYQRITAR